jgi:hypothetical protein
VAIVSARCHFAHGLTRVPSLAFEVPPFFRGFQRRWLQFWLQ